MPSLHLYYHNLTCIEIHNINKFILNCFFFLHENFKNWYDREINTLKYNFIKNKLI